MPEAREPGGAGESIGDYSFPENLSDKDKDLAIEQCRIQHATSSEEIENFGKAYGAAKEFFSNTEKVDSLTAEGLEEKIQEWAELTVPKKNFTRRNGLNYRLVEAEVGGGPELAIRHEQVPHAMQVFSQAFVELLQTRETDDRYNEATYYKEFERIHPFDDGNGRVGDLLWKGAVAVLHGKWPEELPPDVFKEL